MRKLCSSLTRFPLRLIPDCIRNHPPTLSEQLPFNRNSGRCRSFWNLSWRPRKLVCRMAVHGSRRNGIYMPFETLEWIGFVRDEKNVSDGDDLHESNVMKATILGLGQRWRFRYPYLRNDMVQTDTTDHKIVWVCCEGLNSCVSLASKSDTSSATSLYHYFPGLLPSPKPRQRSA